MQQSALTTGLSENPPQSDEKTFTLRITCPAETKAELGGFHLWAYDLNDAKPLLEEALKGDPKLPLAHEIYGLLDFVEGKDEDAAHEFTQAYELDSKQYLSLFYRTMLSPISQSDVPADQGAFRNGTSEYDSSEPGICAYETGAAGGAAGQSYGRARDLPAGRNNWNRRVPAITC